ncbi:MAG: hypothetical protein ACI9EW_003229 [Cellvibrionaceae bacterium]
MKLLSKVIEIMPDHAQVILLGDGGFDGIELQKAVSQIGWHNGDGRAVSFCQL